MNLLNHFVSRACYLAWSLVMAAVAIAWCTPGVAGQELNVRISLKNGSVITVQVPDQIIRWTDVAEDGSMVKRDIQLSEIEELVLSSSPASDQVAAIRGYLGDLQSDKYFERQNAEEMLSDPSIGGPFQSLIESQLKHKDFEVRYRIERIISRLDNEVEEADSEFDRLQTAKGQTIYGDAGDFNIQGMYRDQKVEFKRSQISLLSVPGISADAGKQGGKEVKVQMFHDHNGSFYLDGQRFISFEASPAGHELPDKGDITETFIPVGLKLGTEQNGFVGISGYGFKFDLLPVSGKSVCVFENMGNYHKRFRGVMELEFCMPNLASVPAGVNEIGLFIARVGHSRDIIMEAYNADGHLLACVESTDKPCVFTGVKSNELITKVRILSNPHLFRVDRSIDNDYAIDSVCFSTPKPVRHVKNSKTKGFRLKNGDLFSARDLKPDKTVSADVNGKAFDVPIEEVDLLQFARQELRPKTPSWVVLLEDGSLLYVKTGNRFTSNRFPALSFDTSEIVAITTSKNPVRFPAEGDFDQGKNVIVFPTCRIVDEVEFSQRGFTWDISAKKLQQPLFTGKEDPDEEDPTPQIDSILYEKAWPENIPTVWLSRPKTQSPSIGRIRLVDGQQLAIGENASFQLKEMNRNNIVLSVGGRDTTILLKDILSIDLPDTN